MTTNHDFSNDDTFGPDTLEDKLNKDLLEEPEQESETSEQTPDEVNEAKKHGHLSEEDYKKKHGSLEGYKSPEEFNKYGKAWNEVGDVIKGMKKQLDDRDKQLEALVKYNERTEERATIRARQQLEAQLNEAKRLGDTQAVEQLAKEKAKIEFSQAQQLQENSEAIRMQVEREFRDANKHWMGINQTMTSRVQQIDKEERDRATQAGIGLTYQQLANVVTARMRIEFPEEMLSGNAGNNAPSLSSSRSSVDKSIGTSDSYDKIFNKLESDHIAVFKATNNMLLRQKRMPYTKKEFIEKLRKDGEI